MADIVYKIEYDDETPFQFPKPNVRTIGTPDRIGFVTTKDTAEYLKKEGKRVALKPVAERDPFDGGMGKIYFVPDRMEEVKFFVVKKEGKRKNEFLIRCGEAGLHDENFEAWGAEPKPRTGGPPPPPHGPSIPLP